MESDRHDGRGFIYLDGHSRRLHDLARRSPMSIITVDTITHTMTQPLMAYFSLAGLEEPPRAVPICNRPVTSLAIIYRMPPLNTRRLRAVLS